MAGMPTTYPQLSLKAWGVSRKEALMAASSASQELAREATPEYWRQAVQVKLALNRQTIYMSCIE